MATRLLSRGAKTRMKRGDMGDTRESDAKENVKGESGNRGVLFGVWKHYGETAGADKNWMIQIVTWLVGFSSATVMFKPSEISKFTAVVLTVLGMLFSFLAGFTALLYGGYATRNWAKANRIAKEHKWPELRENYDPFTDHKIPRSSVIPLRLARPCGNGIALVFWIYFLISILSFSVHVARLLYIAFTGKTN